MRNIQGCGVGVGVAGVGHFWGRGVGVGPFENAGVGVGVGVAPFENQGVGVGILWSDSRLLNFFYLKNQLDC